LYGPLTQIQPVPHEVEEELHIWMDKTPALAALKAAAGGGIGSAGADKAGGAASASNKKGSAGGKGDGAKDAAAKKNKTK